MKQLSWDQISQRTLNLYRKVLGSGKKSKNPFGVLVLTLIIAVAIFFRFWELSSRFIFSGEANNILYHLQDLLSGKHSVLLGPVAIGYSGHLFHPPWYLYSMVPIYILSGGEPLVFAILHSAVGVVNVFLIYKIGKNLKSKKLGYIASFIYAVTLKIILIDRTFWGVSLVLFATTLAIYLLIISFKNNKKLYFILLGLWFGFSLSFHYQMAIVVLVGLSLIFLKRRSFFIHTLLSFIVMLLPLIIFDIRHSFFNLRGFYHVAKILIAGKPNYVYSKRLVFSFPIIIIFVSYIFEKFNTKFIVLTLLIYLIVQTQSFLNYKSYPNFTQRNILIKNILDKYDNGLSVYFKNKDAYEYRYLLYLRAKQRNLDTNKIYIYYPWSKPEVFDVAIDNDKIVLPSK